MPVENRATTVDEPVKPVQPSKTIRIAVSKDVVLTKSEMEVVDSKVFQRLRKLKQLGLTYLIYPSAVHTRFEHSLGCLKVADEMVRMINNNIRNFSDDGGRREEISKEHHKLVRYAALLHDIGNIPFGHTLEDETKVITEHQDSRNRIEQAVESISAPIIKDIGEKRFEILKEILIDEKDENGNPLEQPLLIEENALYIKDIVKNTVCADLIDYIQRDAYFCNLNMEYGDRFLQYLYIGKVDDNERIIIRTRKPQSANPPRMSVFSEIIQLIWNRCLLAERVYFHHAKMATAAMLSRAMLPIVRDKTSEDYKTLTEIGDEELLNKLGNNEKTITKKLALALNSRNLYKTACYLQRDALDTLNTKAPKVYDGIVKLHYDYEYRQGIEDKIAQGASLRAGDVLIYAPDPNMNLKQAEAFVYYNEEIPPVKLCGFKYEPQVAKQLNNIKAWHEMLWQARVFVSPEKLPADDPEKSKNVKDMVKAAANNVLKIQEYGFKTGMEKYE